MELGWVILQIVNESINYIDFIYISQLDSFGISTELLTQNEVPIVINSPQYESLKGSFLHVLYVDDFQDLW